ncbi:MAG: GldG family protein [Alphaproteobacteria bacterium]|nr:GldG family protein [Alphaproteobacteria bacterium]
MIDKIKNADRSVLATLSIGLAIIFFLAFNALINTAFTASRLDLTEDQLFTLSDGTKDLLAAIDEPIDVRLYYSRRFNEIGPDIARHSTRVSELLGEYERLSNGNVRIEVFDPEPFSPEEDLAVSDGLQGLPFDQSGERVYFGLAGTNSTDDADAIGYLAPERSPFLEYDLTRLIHNLANPDKARVSVLSDLPLQGTQFDSFQPWLIVDGMKQFFDVQFMERDDTELPDGTEVLVLAAVHTLNATLAYNIDQFVMNGGRVLAFVDPFAESMALAGPSAGQLPPPGVGIATMQPLLASWGVEMPLGKFVANSDDAVRVGFPDPETGQQVAVDYVAWLTLQGERFTAEDSVSAQLQRIVVSSTGAFLPIEGATTKLEPLIFTSNNSNLMNAFEIAQQPNPIALIEKFEPEDKSYAIAARVSGDIKSAFPDGPPKEVLDAAEDADAVKAAHLAESKAPLNAILVGDADFLADRNWAQVQDIGGQRLTVPSANNADFAINALDNLRGSQALVGLRGRGFSVRPFQVIADMRQEADDKFRAREQELLTSIQAIEVNIENLQREEQATGVPFTAAQQQEIDNFRVEMLQSRRDLREVQRSLRNNVETLENRVRVINIWAVPVVIAILALLLALVRRMRRARFYRAALH